MSTLIKLTIDVRVLNEDKLRKAAERVRSALSIPDYGGARTLPDELVMATGLTGFFERNGDLADLGLDVENEHAVIVREEGSS